MVLRYFVASKGVFDEESAAWGENYTLAEINRDATSVYFVVVTAPDEDVVIDAQELKMPAMDYRAAAADAERTSKEI